MPDEYGFMTDKERLEMEAETIRLTKETNELNQQTIKLQQRALWIVSAISLCIVFVNALILYITW